MAYLLNQPYDPATNPDAPMPPEMLARKRQFGESMLQEGMDTSPIRSPWQGAARLAQALMGGIAINKANKTELGYRSQAMKNLEDALNPQASASTGFDAAGHEIGPEGVGSATAGMAAAPTPSGTGQPDIGRLMTAAADPYLSQGAAGIANALMAHQFKMYDPVKMSPGDYLASPQGGVIVPPVSTGHWMTADEKITARIPQDQPMWQDATGKPSSGTGMTVNVGEGQTDYGKQMAGAVASRHVALANGVEAAADRQRDIHAMQAAVQRIQANGGTTGLGEQELANLKNAINTGANALGLDQPFDISDPEFLQKFNRQIAGQMAKASTGARVTNFELQNYLKSNPGIEMSPQGNVRLLGIMNQIEQRNIEVGQAIRDAAAAAVSDGKKPDPRAIEQIILNYDRTHHIKDPLTGQDLTAEPKLQDYQGDASVSGAAPAAKPVVINGYTITPNGP